MAKSGRVFLRGMTSQTYGLGEFRRRQLAAPRVRSDSLVVDDATVAHSGDSEQSKTWWRVGPGDDPFLTQTLRVHFVQLPPYSSDHGHGHQNLSGSGYSLHWEVEAEIAEKYYARIANEPTRHEFKPDNSGDVGLVEAPVSV